MRWFVSFAELSCFALLDVLFVLFADTSFFIQKKGGTGREVTVETVLGCEFIVFPANWGPEERCKFPSRV